jgi:hypothetical protein
MTGHGKRGKPNPGFPRFPQPLEIAVRFPHSHRPGGCLFVISNQKKRRPSCGSLGSRLQAHPSMRKCFVAQADSCFDPQKSPTPQRSDYHVREYRQTEIAGIA